METLPAAMALPDVVAEIGSLQSMMGDRGSLYWKDPGKQARYRDLLDARDGDGTEIDDPAEDAFVAAEMSPVSAKSAPAGLDYMAYLRAVQSAGDIVFQVPAGERESLIRSFNSLPDAVSDAMTAELMNRAGTGFAPASEAEVRQFSREIGGRVVREWGNDTQQLMGRVRARLNRAMDAMTEVGADRFEAWLEGLTDGQAAAVFRKLAV